MVAYRIAGQEIRFAHPVIELDSFKINIEQPAADLPPVPVARERTCQAMGWLGGELRNVERWSAPPGSLLRVAGVQDVYLAPHGDAILQSEGSALDRELLLGPGLVLTLALRRTWCLHASAVMVNGMVIALAGESESGKSTLARWLDDSTQGEWRRVADDILPVTIDGKGVTTWMRFPQLKLPAGEQPGMEHDENFPLKSVCVLEPAKAEDKPVLEKVNQRAALEILLSHTAGMRLFGASQVKQHMEDCSHAAQSVDIYRMRYPHMKSTLPEVRKILETIC